MTAKESQEAGTPMLLPLVTAITDGAILTGGKFPSAFIGNCWEENALLQRGSAVAANKKRRVRERLKEAEKWLQKFQPVAIRFKEAGKALLVVLEDQTVLQYKFSDAIGRPEVRSIKIDRSVAEQSQERVLSTDIDVTCQLMVSATRNGRLLLYDARKHGMGAERDRLGASGTCLLDAQTAASVALPGPATRVRVNCSSDLVLAQCGSNLVIIHVTCGAQGRRSSSAVRQISLSAEEAAKARAHTTTDDVISCCFSRHLPNRVLVLQRRNAEGETLLFVACVFEYQEAQEQLHLVTSSSVAGLESNVTSVAWTPREDQVVLGTRDGALVLHDLERGTLRTVPGCGRGELSMLTWHPDGAVLAAAFENGELVASDAALQRTEFASDLRPALESLHLSRMHGFKCHVAAFEWAAPPVVPAREHPRYAHAALVMERGPVDVLRFPVRNPDGRLRSRDFVRHYLDNGLPEKALALADALSDALERYHCLLQLLPFLLRQTLNPAATDALLARSAALIASHQWEGLRPEQAAALRSLVRRYGQKLIRAGSVELAFRLGKRLEDDALLSDVLVWALRNDAAALAAAAKRAVGYKDDGTERDAADGPLCGLASIPTPLELRHLHGLSADRTVCT